MKSIISRQYFALAFVAFIAMAFAINFVRAQTIESETDASEFEHYYHFLMTNATTTQATSTPAQISGADKVQVYFNYNDGSGTATTTFTIQVSPNEGVDWYPFNKLVSNIANTNAQQVTRVASLQAVGTTSATYAMDLQYDTFDMARCVVTFASTTVTATDNATCEMSVEF